MISYDSQRGGVSVITEKGDITTSYLLVQNADLADSGRYSCSPSNADVASVRVHVLNGKYPCSYLLVFFRLPLQLFFCCLSFPLTSPSLLRFRVSLSGTAKPTLFFFALLSSLLSSLCSLSSLWGAFTFVSLLLSWLCKEERWASVPDEMRKTSSQIISGLHSRKKFYLSFHVVLSAHTLLSSLKNLLFPSRRGTFQLHRHRFP